jgi:hypothetical protein
MAPKRQASLKASAALSTRKKPTTTTTRRKSTSAAEAHPDHGQVLERMRQFDLNPQYGPCVGITRLERWERAQRLGRMPPAEVKAALTDPATTEAIPDINKHLWHDIL